MSNYSETNLAEANLPIEMTSQLGKEFIGLAKENFVNDIFCLKINSLIINEEKQTITISWNLRWKQSKGDSPKCAKWLDGSKEKSDLWEYNSLMAKVAHKFLSFDPETIEVLRKVEDLYQEQYKISLAGPTKKATCPDNLKPWVSPKGFGLNFTLGNLTKGVGMRDFTIDLKKAEWDGSCFCKPGQEEGGLEVTEEPEEIIAAPLGGGDVSSTSTIEEKEEEEVVVTTTRTRK
jgi:hypothetical protein